MPGGRPRKYSTAAAALEAKRISNRLRYQRRYHNQGLHNQGLTFIEYKPLLSRDTPRPNPTSTGLRISRDILLHGIQEEADKEIMIEAEEDNYNGEAERETPLEWQLPASTTLPLNDPKYTREVERVHREVERLHGEVERVHRERRDYLSRVDKVNAELHQLMEAAQGLVHLEAGESSSTSSIPLPAGSSKQKKSKELVESIATLAATEY
jgi:hypothetical protein